MPAVSPADGPVAVTGASGYIGSWIVHDLLEQGYAVRACVRDKTKTSKVEHLLRMGADDALRGSVELFQADLAKPGSYDAAFAGCCAVIHAAAGLGHNSETPQQVYDLCYSENEHVLESVRRAGTVRRFVFTSSMAAVIDPRPDGYVYTEHDWFASHPEGWRGKCTEENIGKVRDIAYAFAKMRSEKLCYAAADASGGAFEAMAILPLHVIGPLMCANHDQGWAWQSRIRRMMQGEHPKFKMLWNCCDVRDTAKMHRLCIESAVAHNGSRYISAAANRSGELEHWQLAQRLQELYPGLGPVSGNEGPPERKTRDLPRSYCLLAMQELGLQPRDIDDTLRANVDTCLSLGLIKPSSAAAKL